ncbi:MAG: hypothetical protein AAF829_09575, partial [Pseudomonadota bacterium]
LRSIVHFIRPLAGSCILTAMEALRDPFSRVHPFFWPVLWLSLRAFVRWTGRMIEEGHGFAGLRIELTWYGTIHVRAIDLSGAGKAFRRHMVGARPEDGWDLIDAAAIRAARWISPADCGSRFGSGALHRQPVIRRACVAHRVFAPWHSPMATWGNDPPLRPAPVSGLETGAAPVSLERPTPAKERAPVLVKRGALAAFPALV